MPAVPIIIPSVGESITEGTLSRWLKADGSRVQAGEPLFELETDKVTSDVPASSSGVLKIEVAEGQTVAIGATIGTIDPAGSPAAVPPPAAAKPAPPSTTAGVDRPSKPVAKAGPAAAEPGDSRPLSPAVRRLVAEEDVDLARVDATGPGGRITKGDVLAFIESAATQPAAASAAPSPAPSAAPTAPSPAAAVPGSAGPRETRRPMSRLRVRIAQRLVEVQQTAAILTTFNEADMSRVIELRTVHKEAFQKKHGVGLGFSSFFIKAVIEALKAFPAVNARIEGNEIVYQNFHDIGMAVSTERGLMVPVVRDADRISFAAIERAVADFAARARQGTIAVDDLQGGTFTITNGGVFGSLMSTPILNPPQSAILGMHAIKKRPVVVDDQIVIRPMMYLALSYDHRLIDGREAVGFLVRVKDCVENPERLMLENPVEVLKVPAEFDLVVIGAGPGGYVAAIRAAQLGMKVACVEKSRTLGGTCLNVGCIPSKAMLDSSELFHLARERFNKHGIKLDGLTLDLATMLARKDGVVKGLTDGVRSLFRKNRIETIFGTGKVSSASSVSVAKSEGGSRDLQTGHILLATGSEPAALASLPFDGRTVVDSTGALSFDKVPDHLVVVGAGYIGLELGSVWKRLGAKVTVIEFLPRIVPSADLEMGDLLKKSLAKQGLEFHLGTKVTGASIAGDRATVHAEKNDGTKLSFPCARVLVAVGRRPYTQGLGLSEAGVSVDPRTGKVPVDSHYRTSVPSISAIGDLIEGPMLAHKAEDEGVAFAEILAGKAGHVDYNTVPGVIYTWPELASVGLDEEQARQRGLKYRVGKFPFLANGRAKAMDETEGLVKILADATTDRVVGVHILGPRASELIAEVVMVMQFAGSAEDIARTCHAHPTLAEATREAALAVDGRAIHM